MGALQSRFPGKLSRVEALLCALMFAATAAASPAFADAQAVTAPDMTEPPPGPLQVAADAPLSDKAFLPESWEFQVLPYFWAISIDGDATVKGQDADVDVPFSDILDQLNFGIFAEVEARKHRFGLYANVLYADLETDAGVGPLDIEVSTKVFLAGAGASYRLGPYPVGSRSKVILDPYAGVRYTVIDVDLDISGQRNVGGDQKWLDPVVGLRGILQLTPKWSLTGLGDVGGFGVGSDFTWQALGAVGYRFGLFGEDNATALAGYRALGQDYSDGDGASEFKWDVVYHGPIAGLSIRF